MKQNGSNGAEGLSDRQLAALPYIATAPTLSEAARRAEVGRATLYRWLEDRDFREELERWRRGASELASLELKGLMLKATQVLGEAMDDDATYIRLRAAQAALSLGLRAVEQQDIQNRLDYIEDTMPLWARKEAAEKWLR